MSSKNDAGAAGADAHLIYGTVEAFAKVDAAFGAEAGDGFAGFAVEGIEEVAPGEEDAVLVDGDAPVTIAALRALPPEGSKDQISWPVAAFRAMTRSLGVVA